MKGVEYKTIQLEYYTEGPAMDMEGNIYCTNLTGGAILKIARDSSFGVWAHSRCPNGQVILSNGDRLVCDSQLASVVRYNSQGVFLHDEIQESCSGIKVFVPNDLVVDETEGFYFTDSIRHEGKIFYRSSEGTEHIVAIGLDYPNGLALSSDERSLFVAESYKNRIIAIEIDAPGITTKDWRIVTQLPTHASGKAESNLPDGLAIDHKNQIWVAHYGMETIQVISMNGEKLHSIKIPFPLVSNIFFSTTNSSEVIVTGGYGEPGPGAICILTIKY